MTNPTALVNIRVQTLVVIISCLLFGIKLLAYFLTESVAVLTDALESTVNVVTGFTGLYSLKIAARPRDENHPYGHGKVELISASFEGILILVAGLIIIYEAIANLLHPHALRDLDYGIALILITAIANYVLGWHCLRIGKKKSFGRPAGKRKTLANGYLEHPGDCGRFGADPVDPTELD